MAYSEYSKGSNYHNYQLAIIKYKALCPILSIKQVQAMVLHENIPKIDHQYKEKIGADMQKEATIKQCKS